jgi:hypothetical protein
MENNHKNTTSSGREIKKVGMNDTKMNALA